MGDATKPGTYQEFNREMRLFKNSNYLALLIGGNSPSSSNRKHCFGGDSVAAAISWNFSESKKIKNSIDYFDIIEKYNILNNNFFLLVKCKIFLDISLKEI